jgi:hypothetical protein
MYKPWIGANKWTHDDLLTSSGPSMEYQIWRIVYSRKARYIIVNLDPWLSTTEPEKYGTKSIAAFTVGIPR